LSRVKKAFAIALTSALVLAAVSAPALAINDGRVPADECSGNPKSVGEPTGVPLQNPGINTADPVAPPVSGPNNPGVSTGALGQINSNATTTGNCTANP
jgi:hypothetical protein